MEATGILKELLDVLENDKTLTIAAVTIIALASLWINGDTELAKMGVSGILGLAIGRGVKT